MSSKTSGLDLLISGGFGAMIGAAAAKPSDYEKLKTDHRRLESFYKDMKPFIEKLKKRRAELIEKKLTIKTGIPQKTFSFYSDALFCYTLGRILASVLVSAKCFEIHLKFLFDVLNKHTPQNIKPKSFNDYVEWAISNGFLPAESGKSIEAINLRQLRNIFAHQDNIPSHIDALTIIQATKRLCLYSTKNILVKHNNIKESLKIVNAV